MATTNPARSSDRISLTVPVVAYFSMEIGLRSEMPTYAGGLGILAGDTLRAAADMGLPMVGISLLYRKGYFRQHLDAFGNQTESPSLWKPEEAMQLLPQRISVPLEGRDVQVGIWRYLLKGAKEAIVPIYFLDTALPENESRDQSLSDCLYGGDQRYRLCQEAVLGLGGVKALESIGHKNIRAFHMNEGHSALLTLALLEKRMAGRPVANAAADRDAVRRRCVFTTHTPVPAGHDRFPLDLVRQVLGEARSKLLVDRDCCWEGVLNMTHLALIHAHYINGVAMRHGEISRTMYPHYPIDSITNGVHALTWTSPHFCKLFDHHFPAWREDHLYLRHALIIPRKEIAEAHRQAKRELLAEVKNRTGTTLDPDCFTIGFARRMTAYKRPAMIFAEQERLKAMASRYKGMQLLFAGKAHPQDQPGKDLIRDIYRAATALKGTIPILFLEEYNMDLGRSLCAGVDLWLNTPQRPDEASGTSGMKAALNGVPSLSILDGWWIEGHMEGVTGWSIGVHWDETISTEEEILSLYNKLESVILPLFYHSPTDYEDIMRTAIAYNGAFFNAQRMLSQYVKHAYSNTRSDLFEEYD